MKEKPDELKKTLWFSFLVNLCPIIDGMFCDPGRKQRYPLSWAERCVWCEVFLGTHWTEKLLVGDIHKYGWESECPGPNHKLYRHVLRQRARQTSVGAPTGVVAVNSHHRHLATLVGSPAPQGSLSRAPGAFPWRSLSQRVPVLCHCMNLPHLHP